jgi:hypothetical protein
MSITNDMKRIAANRRTNREFEELTRDINMPNIRANQLNRKITDKIETFLKGVNGNPLQNEKLVFDNNIVGTYQHKFIKENAGEISFDTSNFRRPQFKELLEKLLLELMNHANYTDSWYIEYSIRGENKLRYQILSRLNENKLEEYIVLYLNNELEALAGSYFFFDAIPADMESIRVIDNTKY